MALPPIPGTDPGDPDEGYPVSRAYAWLAFAMTFALMLSDYMSRQIINAVFPFLKAEWSLSDGQLGSLVGVVALTIGLLSVPISLIADRIGRVHSAAVMALVWGLATIACGFSGNFTQMLFARALVGLGEAGYGSAGTAILTSVFPARMHATIIGSFLAASMLGSVLGVVLGGFVAQAIGWNAAFILIGIFGVTLAAIFPFIIREPPRSRGPKALAEPFGEVVLALSRTPTVWLIAVGGACSMFVQSSFIAWMPSYLVRYYGLDPAKASLGTGLLIMCAALGMVVGGAIVDRSSRTDRINRLRLSALFALILGIALIAAFSVEPGTLQFVLIGLGLAASSSFLGPVLAAATDVTPEASRATTYAFISLGFMLFGAAPGPILTGYVADATELSFALWLVPTLALVAAVLFLGAARTFQGDLDQLLLGKAKDAAT